MSTQYVLHYAPDNASLIVRLAMDEMGVPYRTVLVDRQAKAQRSPAYLRLNPNGLIPVLETPDGPIFETGAILLWLADTHRQMAPSPGHTDRGAFLKWLFFTSNTLHADMRIVFYTDLYAGRDTGTQADVQAQVQARLTRHLETLEASVASAPSYLGADQPSVLDYYLACALRWMALYPAAQDRSWFSLDATPLLHQMVSRLELRAAVQTAILAEGLGQTPFTAPQYPAPPEGSAT